MMTVETIAAIRLQNQLLGSVKASTPMAVVSHFGAIQAQDYSMAKWAIGVRLAESTDLDIENALDAGQIIRIHILRPTWHFVTTEDSHWMMDLVSENIRRQMKAINSTLGLDAKIFSRSIEIIAKSLQNGNHKTRVELMKVLSEHGIPTDGLRGAQIMFEAELLKVVCNGKRNGIKNTYALLEEKVKNPKSLLKAEALAELAKRYFTSHGPATLKDFGWWSGLSVADAKLGVQYNEGYLTSKLVNADTYYMHRDFSAFEQNSTHLLPAFDEFLISYKNRSASIDDSFSPMAFTRNGIFKPLIVVRGKVVGIWKRLIIKDKIKIMPEFFHSIAEKEYAEIIKAAQHYARFMDLELDFTGARP